VNFAIYPGETLGLIGEWGAARRRTSKLILLQETPTARTIRFSGENISALQGQHGRQGPMFANNGNFSGNTNFGDRCGCETDRRRNSAGSCCETIDF